MNQNKNNSEMLYGRITGRDRHFYVIKCHNAPEHLKVMHLTGYQFAWNAPREVGSRVTLVYTKKTNGAGWTAHHPEFVETD